MVGFIVILYFSKKVPFCYPLYFQFPAPIIQEPACDFERAPLRNKKAKKRRADRRADPGSDEDQDEEHGHVLRRPEQLDETDEVGMDANAAENEVISERETQDESQAKATRKRSKNNEDADHQIPEKKKKESTPKKSSKNTPRINPKKNKKGSNFRPRVSNIVARRNFEEEKERVEKEKEEKKLKEEAWKKLKAQRDAKVGKKVSLQSSAVASKQTKTVQKSLTRSEKKKLTVKLAAEQDKNNQEREQLLREEQAEELQETRKKNKKQKSSTLTCDSQTENVQSSQNVHVGPVDKIKKYHKLIKIPQEILDELYGQIEGTEYENISISQIYRSSKEVDSTDENNNNQSDMNNSGEKALNKEIFSAESESS